MNSKSITILTLLSLLLVVSFSVHMKAKDAPVDEQLQLLKTQQDAFQVKINELIKNVTKVQQNLNNSDSTSEKVLILEQAIISQRQQIFQIEKILIPEFNISQCTCDQLTDQQKVHILDQIVAAKEQLTQLKMLADTVPPCDQLDQINADLQKEQYFLDTMESVIYTECKVKAVLTPTVFQTNIYAKGWILGPQTINDLIDQYYQRSIKYDHVTNCPLDAPFYNGKKCIACPTKNPVFNMFDRNCTACEGDYEVDNDLKKCVPVIHFTDFETYKNWALDGANQLPNQQNGQSPCAQTKPFFDGEHCQACHLPQYWSVKQNNCSTCSQGLIFDVNLHQCSQPLLNKLTILQNTNWVTNDGNLTRVLQERVKILQANKTSRKYTYCATDIPFYDGVQCVSCPEQFNMDTKQCTKSKTGYIYNPNTREYLYVDQDRESNFKAGQKYIQSNLVKHPDNPQIENCPKEKPWFNGNGCVICLNPFNVFDVDARQCIACDSDKIYNKTTRKCQDRQIIYITRDINRIMATDNVSVQQYKQKTLKMINDHPEAIVMVCPNQQDQSNYQKCFPCPTDSYLNIQTLECDYCDGRIDNITKKCLYKAYLFTNLNAPNIVNFNVNKQEQQARIDNFINVHPNSKICSSQTPYSNNQSCIICSNKKYPLFDYVKQKCTNCSANTMYIPDAQQCQPFKYLTNLDAKNILLGQGQTLDSLKSQQDQQKAAGNTQTCPATKPYTDDGSNCFTCQVPNNIFNAETKSCFSCPNNFIYDEKTYICRQIYYITNPKANNFIVSQNATMEQLIQEENKIKNQQFYQACSDQTPYSTGTSCVACDQKNKHFSLAEKACVSCPDGQSYIKQVMKCQYVYYLTRLDDQKLLEDGDATIDRLEQEQTQLKETQITSLCPKQTPYSEGTNCIACQDSSTPYFNIATLKCQNCKQQTGYFAPQRKCKDLVNLINTKALTNGTVNNYIETQDKNLSSIIQDNQKVQSQNPVNTCPVETPFSNGKQCLACNDTQLPYFNLQTKQCEACPRHYIYDPQRHVCRGTNPYTNLTAIKNYIQEGNGTIANIQAKIQSVKDDITYYECPAKKPYSSGKDCLLPCSSNSTTPYFNLNTNKCQGCPQDFRYNKDQHICKPIIPRYPNLANSKWIINDGQPQKVVDSASQLQKVQGSVICQIQHPFYSDKQRDCFSCKDGYYWNYDDDQCQKCDPKAFDINWHQCFTQEDPNTYQTSLQANNLIYGGISQAQYQEIYDENKQNYPEIKDCSKDKPYYDGITCITCPQQYPYFNMKSQLCMICPQGSEYNDQFHDCMRKNSVVTTSPNPEKMYANIF